jgi:hypothetical protein
VTAGPNPDKAQLAIDDDETTSWSNDGSASAGWIRFTTGKPTAISEVTLKLGGWRTKSYPVRVLVDDKVVFTGETPRSLGYITLTFPPTEGKTLTIEPLGRSRDKDAFGAILEVTGEQDAASRSEQRKGGGALNIVEAEIYGPLMEGQSK